MIENICIHHFGGTSNPLAKTSSLTEHDINIAHKSRWSDFPSELNGSFIGYNCIIWPDGTLKQYRYVGEETAAQRGHNFNTISFCLAGNFTQGIEQPTIEQKMRLKSEIQALLHGNSKLAIKPNTKLNLSESRIYPHRKLQSNTQCYGTGLSDLWIKDLVKPLEKPIPEQNISQLELLIKKLLLEVEVLKLRLAIKLRFGGNGSCQPERG